MLPFVFVPSTTMPGPIRDTTKISVKATAGPPGTFILVLAAIPEDNAAGSIMSSFKPCANEGGDSGLNHLVGNSTQPGQSRGK